MAAPLRPQLRWKELHAHRRRGVAHYLAGPVRPAAHAGSAYAADPDELREELASLFAGPGGPGPVSTSPRRSDRTLAGIICPHIDLYRGGATYAWAYRRLVEESTADLFVILGTAHQPMRQLFSLTRKDFDTPLGVVPTHRPFLDRLADRLAADSAASGIDLYAEELAHRHEHSIEFQAVFLRFLLGRKRPFAIVPVLVGSFYPFVQRRSAPDRAPEVQALVRALRAEIEAHKGSVCLIGAADLAHIGPCFGDRDLLDKSRLAVQASDDRRLMAAACRGSAARFFRHVARNQDRNRICGLAPLCVLLETIGPVRGELLRYDQAVETDGTSCVSFASVALYRT